MAAFDAAGLSDARNAAHGVRAGTGQGGLFPELHQSDDGSRPRPPVAEPLAEKMVALLRKAGYEVVFPENMERLCCDTIWESKGMADIADRKTAELEEALWRASGEGRWPMLCDQSPCLHRMREKIGRMKLYEPAEFIWTFLRDRLEFRPQPGPVAVHVTCSMRRMGLAGVIVALARLCADEVVVPEEVADSRTPRSTPGPRANCGPSSNARA